MTSGKGAPESGSWLFLQESSPPGCQANKAKKKLLCLQLSDEGFLIRAVGHRIESISVFRVLFHKRHELITSGDDSDVTLRLEYNNPRCLAGNDPLHLAEMKQVVTLSALRPPPKIRVLVSPLWLRAKLSRRKKRDY